MAEFRYLTITELAVLEQEAPATEYSLLEIVPAADEERAALLAEAETAKRRQTTSISTGLADIQFIQQKLRRNNSAWAGLTLQPRCNLS